MRRQPFARFLLAGAVAGTLGLSALSFGFERQPVHASQALANPGFESWSDPWPSGWLPTGAGWTKAAGEGNPGNAIRYTAGSGTGTLPSGPVSVVPGAAVSGSIEATGSGVAVQARLRFLDADENEVTTVSGSPVPVGAAFAPSNVFGTAPAGAEYVALVVTVTGAGGGWALLDNASLGITEPEPTATPTLSPTQTATPEPEETPTPTATTAAEPTVPGEATATRTPSVTRTPSPTKSPAATKTASPTREPTATKTPSGGGGATPKATKPLPTSTPTVAPGSGFGGLLANGDFETVTDGKPDYWHKYGGTMFADGTSVSGVYAGCLESDTVSTKWLYQVVSATAGDWYAATAYGRITGGGGVSLRVSWYASEDGSGSQLDQVTSDVADSVDWTFLQSGPVQAPGGTHSARVRLTLQPEGPATGCFDDAMFVPAEAPAATPVPPADETTAVPGAASTATPRPSAPVASRPGAGNTPGTYIPLLGALTSGPGVLRIAEVMSDPAEAGRDAAYEWVELANPSAEPVDTTGWKLGDSTRTDTLTAVVVPPGGFVVVAGASAEFAPGVLVIRLASGQIGGGLGNDGDHLVLAGPDGQVVDEMSYGSNVKVFDPAPAAPARGKTLGLVDPAADPARENWRETLRPTPGEPNVFAPSAGPTAGQASGFVGSADVSGTGGIESNVKDGSLNPAWLVLGLTAAGSCGFLAAKFGPAVAGRVRKLRRSLR